MSLQHQQEVDQGAPVSRCNTCKASFSSVDLLKRHYKSDWHVLNSRRRSSNLPRLSWEQFRRLPSSSTNVVSSSSSSSSNKKKDSSHISAPLSLNASSSSSSSSSSSAAAATSLVNDTKNHSSDHSNSAPSSSKELYSDPSAPSPPPLAAEEERKKRKDGLAGVARELGLDSQRTDRVVSMALQEEEEDELEDEDEDEEEIVVEPNVSLFDNKELPGVEENVRYMAETFGFFVPEREFLTSLEALLCYLGEKIKLGGICIYCQKQFRPGRPCQDHMKSLSHCKIAFEEGVDMEELEDFYDFSSSYGKKGGDDEDDEDEGAYVENELEVSSIGELVLQDGRCLGHRAFRRYYKQKYKPDDEKESVQVARKEELLKLYKKNCVARTMVRGEMRSDSLASLSDREVMSLILKEHKEQKKFRMIEQRAQKRLQYANNRREYTSVKDKLRSSATTTAKIRDYHSMLC